MSAEEIESMCRQAEVDARAMAASKWQHGEWAAGQLRMMAKTVVTLSAELAKAREACEQGKARCQNFLNGLLPACGPMTSATAVMISSIQNDFKEALGHDFEAEVKPLAAKGPTNE